MSMSSYSHPEKRTGKGELASSGVPHRVFSLATHTPWPVLLCW